MTARLAAWWRRRHRVAIPFGLALIVLVTVGVAHEIRADDPSSPSFLNPDSTAGDGAATLAARLRAAGVDIVRVTDSETAVDDAVAGGATLFVPEPQFVLAGQLARLGHDASSPVVLLAPDAGTLDRAGITGVRVGSRWATHTVDPGCDRPEAVSAGPAAADRVEYTGRSVTASCYGGGLVAVADGGRALLVAGAGDPFRNDRIGEAGNAALAAALLGGRPKLIWLDVHHPEHLPEPTPSPTPTVRVTPSRTVNSDPPVGPGTGPIAGGGDDDGGQSDKPTKAARPRSDNPINLLLPTWVWGVIALCGLAVLVYALSRARRFGPPVEEPLPVAAYARETIEGRGRLYRQARAPGDAFRGPSRGALAHMRSLLGLPAGAPPRVVVRAVAAATRREPEDVAEVLDAIPKTDAELVAAVAALDELVQALQNTPTREEPS